MAEVIVIVLLGLWFLGYVRIPGLVIPRIQLFSLNGRGISLWDVLIFLVVSWAISILPTPLRQIAFVLLALWISSIFGFLAIGGLSSILVVAIIIGVVISVFR